MIQQCAQCNEEFAIPSDDLTFYATAGTPRYHGTRVAFPPPNYCPDCRRQRRLAFRNERFLYRRTCDFSGKQIFSIYSPDKKQRVYDRNIWWSDVWNAFEYGRDFDFSRPFFEQFQELHQETPLPSARIIQCENSEYGHYLEKSKNSYLLFDSSNCFDCMYLEAAGGCRDTLTSYRVSGLDQCFHMYRGSNCTRSYYCDRVSQCDDCYFCKLSGDCKDCFGCFCIRHRQYCIFNRQYTRKEYFEFLRKIDFGSHAEIQKLKARCRAFWDTMPINPTSGEFNDDCWGDYVYYANHCYHCFTINNCDRCKYCFELNSGNFCYDLDCVSGAGGSSYQCVSANQIFNMAFSYDCYRCSDSFYSSHCTACVHVFGCVGLESKNYCIFNKQYSQPEYEKLVLKIIQHMQDTGEWAQFFPYHVSPFGYNETEANFHFPLSREEALQASLNWCDYENPRAAVDKVLKAQDLPDNIKDVNDTILEYAIECEATGRLFKIQRHELAFYRNHKIPLPRRHPEQRATDFHTLRNPIKFVTRRCQCKIPEHNHADGGRCDIIMPSTFPNDYPELVWCTPCFTRWTYE